MYSSQVSTQPLFFGPILYSGYPQVEGLLDDIRIYNRALSDTEISSLYHEGLCYEMISVTDTLFINTNITSYNPIQYKHTIKIYPNPTKDNITIECADYSTMKGYRLKILNSLAQEVFNTSIAQQKSVIALSSLSGKGLYLVYLINDKNEILDVKKIVLQ